MKNTFFLYDEDQNLWFLHFGLNSFFVFPLYLQKQIFFLVSLYFSFEAKNPNSDSIIDAYGWFVKSGYFNTQRTEPPKLRKRIPALACISDSLMVSAPIDLSVWRVEDQK